MKKIMLASILSTFAIIAPSSANASDINLHGLYLGTGTSNIKLQGSIAGLASKNTLEAHIGYAISPNVSIEYRRYLSNYKASEFYQINQANVYGDYNLKNMQSFLIKIKENYKKFNFGVLGGYTTAQLNMNFLNTPIIPNAFANTSFNDKVNLNGFTYGFSTGYDFTKNVSLNIEYQRLFNSKNIKARSIGTNIEYKF